MRKAIRKVVCFRNLKDNVDRAIKLFSNTDAPEALGFVLRKPFADVKKDLDELCQNFKARYPDMASIDKLQSEYDKRNFILAFRDIIRKHSEIQVYEEWNADDSSLIMTEQEYNDYRSKYLDMTMGFIQDDEDDKTMTKEKKMKVWRMKTQQQISTILISVWSCCIVMLLMLHIYWN